MKILIVQFLIFFTIILISYNLQAQQVYEQASYNYNNIQQYSLYGTYYYFTGPIDHLYAGFQDDEPGDRNMYRMRYSWNLSSIPSNATIQSVELTLQGKYTSNFPSSYTQTWVYVKKYETNFSDYSASSWDYMTTAQTLTSQNIPRTIYDFNFTKNFTAGDNFCNYVESKFGGNLYLGITTDESFFSGYSANVLDFYHGQVKIKIIYKAQATNVTFIADNNFTNIGGTDHGNMSIDGSQPQNVPLSGISITRLTGTNLQLGAVSPQNNNQNHQMIWHNGLIYPSNWTRDGVYKNSNQNYSFTVQPDDNGKKYVANLRKNYRIDQLHKFEFGSDILQTNPAYIVEQNSGSITAPQTSTSGNKTGNFAFWTDGPTTRTRIIQPTDNQTYNAFYKLNNYSSTNSAYDKDGQRKFIRDSDGSFWKVYESYGQIWLEKDGTLTKLVNDLSEGPEAKSPSMDFVVTSNYKTLIFIVYQQKLINGKYKLKVAKFDNDGQKIYASDVLTSTYDYSTFDATPVISVTRRDGIANGKPKFVLVWKQKAESNFQNGLYFYAGVDNGSSVGWYYIPPEKLTNTDSQSSDPTIAVFKQYSGGYVIHHLAYQQGTTKIKYRALGDNWNGSQSGGVVQTGSLEEPSLGDGWYYNYEPSIAVVNIGTGSNYGNSLYDSPKLVWKSDYAVTHRAKSNSSTSGVWQTFYNYYSSDDITSAHINTAEEEATYVIVWSELVGYYNRYIKSSSLGTQVITGTHGKNLQVSNYIAFWEGVDINIFNNMTGTSAPYSFQTHNFSEGLSKTTNVIVREGRYGTIIKNDAEFFFGLGDVSCNNSLINFIPFNDSLEINNTTQLNTILTTESFEVNDNIPLSYTLFYGLKDSVAALQNLLDGEFVRFRVELVDAVSNQVIGIFDEITQTNLNLTSYENISYQINTNGIGNRSVFFRLVVNENFEDETFSLSRIYSDNNSLSKSKVNEINWQGNLTITDYVLEQNFPNPFNPSTRIKFQIPNDGFVTLKVYDILGNEIATLLNEEKPQGRYEVNFNAGSLASGVYICKLQAGSFISSKKMLLLK